MKKQIPHGPDDLSCPMWREPMSKVCHTCPLWVHIRGRDPQSSNEVDEWNCTLAFMPKLLIENSAMQRSTAAAVETLSGEVKKADGVSNAMVGTLLTLVNRTLDQAQATSRALEGNGVVQQLLEKH